MCGSRRWPGRRSAVSFAVMLCLATVPSSAAQLFPCLFAFGDASLDTGNAVHLPGAPKEAMRLPYGKTHPGTPTGRFSDGRLVVDHLAEKLGIATPPAFLPQAAAVNGNLAALDYTSGLNFAVAGSGVLRSALWHSSLASQVGHLRAVLGNVSARLPDSAAPALELLVARSLALVSAGAGDYFHSWMAPQGQLDGVWAGRVLPVVHEVVDGILEGMQAAYALGLRRFLVLALPPLGCTPAARLREGLPAGACDEALNAVALQHNRVLRARLNGLRALEGIQVVLADLYEYFEAVFLEPDAAGVAEALSACCGSGPANGRAVCGRMEGEGRPAYTLCSNPSSAVYWDSQHTTDAFNRQLAQSLLGGRDGYALPGCLQDVFGGGRQYVFHGRVWDGAPVYAVGLLLVCGSLASMLLFLQAHRPRPSPRAFQV